MNDSLFQSLPDILNVKQMQEALGIGRSWAYRLLEEKKIKAFRIGNVYKIPKTALLDFINKLS